MPDDDLTKEERATRWEKYEELTEAAIANREMWFDPLCSLDGGHQCVAMWQAEVTRVRQDKDEWGVSYGDTDEDEPAPAPRRGRWPFSDEEEE